MNFEGATLLLTLLRSPSRGASLRARQAKWSKATFYLSFRSLPFVRVFEAVRCHAEILFIHSFTVFTCTSTRMTARCYYAQFICHHLLNKNSHNYQYNSHVFYHLPFFCLAYKNLSESRLLSQLVFLRLEQFPEQN